MPGPRIFRLALKLLFAFGVLAIGYSFQDSQTRTAILQRTYCGDLADLGDEPVLVRTQSFKRGWPFLCFAVSNEHYIGPHPDHVITEWNLKALTANVGIVLALAVGAYRVIPRTFSRSCSLASLIKWTTAIAISLALILILAKGSSGDVDFWPEYTDDAASHFVPFTSGLIPDHWSNWRGLLLAVAFYGTVLLALDACGALFKLSRRGWRGADGIV